MIVKLAISAVAATAVYAGSGSAFAMTVGQEAPQVLRAEGGWMQWAFLAIFFLGPAIKRLLEGAGESGAKQKARPRPPRSSPPRMASGEISWEDLMKGEIPGSAEAAGNAGEPESRAVVDEALQDEDLLASLEEEQVYVEEPVAIRPPLVQHPQPSSTLVPTRSLSQVLDEEALEAGAAPSFPALSQRKALESLQEYSTDEASLRPSFMEGSVFSEMSTRGAGPLGGLVESQVASVKHGGHALRTRLRGGSWRQALILREVLDLPLAMRRSRSQASPRV